MKLSQTTTKGKAGSVAAIALTLMLSSTAMAQDFSSSNSEESLLPPEVVPLDPATANSMSAHQAAQRQSSMGTAGSVATEGEAVPGLVSNGVPNGFQTAKDARTAAFQSLYGQGQVQPILPMQAMGGVSQSQMIGQNPMMNGSGSGAYGTQQVPPVPTQSQRLSGAPKNPSKIRDIKRGGISNTISALAGFGAGAVTAGALMRPTSYPMMLGMYGLTMTGFGVRNAFRF